MDEEAPAVIYDHRPATSWPEFGVIDYDAYSVRYRRSLPLVLRQVTCHIRASEKVGIVGRTGSGQLINASLKPLTSMPVFERPLNIHSFTYRLTLMTILHLD